MYLDYLNKYRKVWQHTRSLPEPLAGFLILLLLAACSPSIRTWRDFLADPTQQSLDDSLSIYTALLKDVYPQEKEFIIDRSTQPFRGELDTIMENSLLPGLQQETAEEFESIREVPKELSLIFEPTEQGTVLVDPAEFYIARSDRGAPDCHWMMMKCFDKIKFNSYYPGSFGYIQLSNIAFNANHTQALTTAEMHNETTSGTIYVVLLSRKGDAWEITSKYELFWVV